MPKYNVYVYPIFITKVEVEAATPEEAQEKAEEEFATQYHCEASCFWLGPRGSYQRIDFVDGFDSDSSLIEELNSDGTKKRLFDERQGSLHLLPPNSLTEENHT